MKALLQFRNLDSTKDLNQQLAGFISKGIISGGDIYPVAGQLKVDVAPFKLIGSDGLVVMEETLPNRVDVVAGQVNVICLKSKYREDQEPVLEFLCLELTAYDIHPEKQYLTVFATVTLPLIATEVTFSDISYQAKDELSPLARASFRGIVSAPPIENGRDRAGDWYMVTDGLGDVPSIYAYNGQDYVNITDSVALASLLNAHRNNLFSNEIHLSDAQADAAQGSQGSPSAINKFVTEEDTRLPSQAENDALVGYPSPLVPGYTPLEFQPAAGKEYVTNSYYAPVSTLISKSFLQSQIPALVDGTAVTIPTAASPVFVGRDNNYLGLIKFIEADVVNNPREAFDDDGNAIRLLGIYTDSGLTQPLDVTTNPNVVNGFYTGSQIYLQVSGDYINKAAWYVNLYTKQSLKNLFASPENWVNPSPANATLSYEALNRFAEISGYEFEEALAPNETNKELAQNVNQLKRYVDTATTGSYVIEHNQFPKLRETEFASEFVQDLSQIPEFAGNVNYTIVQGPTYSAAYNTFDAALNASNVDPDYTAIINYTSPVVLTSVKRGYLFRDRVGALFRVLAVGTNAVMVYTGSKPIATFGAGGAGVGAIYRDNNPMGLEGLLDFQTSFVRESLATTGLVETKKIDSLPLGGIAVGTAPEFTMLSQDVLPKMGSNLGIPAGRKVFYPNVYKQGNILDDRFILVGAWKTKESVSGVVYANPKDSAGLQVTGKLTNLLMYFGENADITGISLNVFVDGAFNRTVALTEAVSYPATDILKTGAAKFGVYALATDLVQDAYLHTIRVELTTSSLVAQELPLYGVDVVYSDTLVIEKGRAHSNIDLKSVDAVYTQTPEDLSGLASKKLLYYVNNAGALDVAETGRVDNVLTGLSILASPNLTLSSLFVNKLKKGDVLLFGKKQGNVYDPAIAPYLRRVIEVDAGASSITLNAAATAIPVDGMISRLFTVPVDSDGDVKLRSITAEEDTLSTEYARFKLADMVSGNDLDVGNINPFAEDRYTVFADGSTAFATEQCQQTTTEVSGYLEGIQFVNANSKFIMHTKASRIDVTFANTTGATTVVVSVAGHDYTLPLKGGVEKHTLFYNGDDNFKTVVLKQAGVPSGVVIAEVALFEYKAASVVGVPVAETVVYETAASMVATPSTFNDVIQYNDAATRQVDILRTLKPTALGAGGTKDWTFEADAALNPIFGQVLKTDRNTATVKFKIPAGTKLIYVYCGFESGSGTINFTGASTASVSLTTLKNKVALAPNTGAQEISISTSNTQPFVIYGLAFRESASIITKRHVEDAKPNYLKLSAFRDVRRFTSIGANNVGLVAGLGEEVTTTTDEVAETGASIQPYDGFDLIVYDNFTEFPNLPASTISSTVTNAAYNPDTQVYRLKCDKSKTVTMAGVNYTLSAAPNFELKVGDVLVIGTQVRRIATVVTATTGTVDVAFTGAFVAVACMVSQAVWTKNLVQVGDATQQTRPMDLYPNQSLQVANIYYEDSLALGDVTFDKVSNPRLAMVASNEGLQASTTLPASNLFGPLQSRPVGTAVQAEYELTSTVNNESLWLGFFCNPTTVDVVTGANLIRYEASIYKSTVDLESGYLKSAYCMSDSSSTPVNCTVAVSGGKTVVTLGWYFIQGLQSGETVSDIEVIIDGKIIPRFVTGVTTEAYWKEVLGRPDQVEMWADLTAAAVSIEIRKKAGVKDFAPVNATKLLNIHGILVGTPSLVAAGVANYSSLQAAITDAPQDSVITLMAGVTVTENVTLGKRLYIQGRGYGSFLNGSLTVSAGSDYSIIKGLRFNSAAVSANGVQITECLFTTAPVDTGIGNHIQGIEV